MLEMRMILKLLKQKSRKRPQFESLERSSELRNQEFGGDPIQRCWRIENFLTIQARRFN